MHSCQIWWQSSGCGRTAQLPNMATTRRGALPCLGGDTYATTRGGLTPHQGRAYASPGTDSRLTRGAHRRARTKHNDGLHVRAHQHAHVRPRAAKLGRWHSSARAPPARLPRPSAAFRGLPRPSAAFRGLPRPSAAFRGLPPPSAAFRGLPRPSAAFRRLPPPSAAFCGLPRPSARLPPPSAAFSTEASCPHLARLHFTWLDLQA